jgi:rhodanese-related sulfurtransferase
MRIKDWLRILLIFSVVLLLFALPMLSACNGGNGEQEEEEEEEEEEEVSEFDIVMEAVEAYLADKAGNMKASDLFLLIAEDNAPYIVSVRSAAHYDAGHIPGAVNVAFGDWDEIPEDEEILVYCYTGQSASFTAALLGVLEYDVQNLLHGMCAWSTDPAVTISKCFDAGTHQGDYTVETTANTVTISYDYPELDNTTSNNEAVIIEAAVATVSPKYITASDLNLKIAEDEEMTIISCRSATDYAGGHIPGAINIGITSLLDNLDKINPDAPVYVYCYTGHTAAQMASLLNLLGYDAYSLKFGMCSWSSDPDVNAGKCFDASTVTDRDVE